MFSGQDVGATAKELVGFAKEHDAIKVVSGLYESQVLSNEQIKYFATLPSREVSLGQVVGTLQAPIATFVRLLSMLITRLLYVLQRIAEQKASTSCLRDFKVNRKHVLQLYKQRSRIERKMRQMSKELIEEIGKLTVIELAELVKSLEEEFGVSAAAPVAAVAAAPAAAEAEAAEEKTRLQSDFRKQLAVKKSKQLKRFVA